MTKKHIDSISCGQGAPSIFTIIQSGEGAFKADVVIVADTGWERDCLWSTGERTDNREFFERVTKPLAEQYGLQAYFVRTKRNTGEEYPPLDTFTATAIISSTPEQREKMSGVNIPVFGSEGGRLKQSCTDKWKVRAIRQQLRLLGAKTATTALGLHIGEVHRLKASDQQWNWNRWPLVDMEQSGGGVKSMGIGRVWNREGIYAELQRRGIPYLISTQCDGCPHKDVHRWKNTSPDTIEQLISLESLFGGQFFLTDRRIPLKDAIAAMNSEKERGTLFDSCDSGYCFL